MVAMGKLGLMASEILTLIRREQPVIHLLTNFVTMNAVAQAVRALGARPIMAFAREEAIEVATAARAVVINLGTPTAERVELMRRIGQAANARRIPIVFDPVGVGASAFRTASAWGFLNAVQVSILRGNAGEMTYLANRTMNEADDGPDGVAMRREGGVAVDVVPGLVGSARLAQEVARRWHTVAVVTGAVDYASDGARVLAVSNGHPFLPQLTGTGDILSALCGACLAVEADALMAAASALIFLGLAGERAGSTARGLGSFQVALLDELSALDPPTLARETRAEWVE